MINRLIEQAAKKMYVQLVGHDTITLIKISGECVASAHTKRELVEWLQRRKRW